VKTSLPQFGEFFVTSRVAILAILLIAAGTHVRAGSVFWSVSGDPSNLFVPDQFSNINLSPQAVVTLGTLGDGSLGFNGGLAVGAGGALYAIANDSSGASSMYKIQTNGATSLVGSAGGLGFGFLGGLTFNPANSTFYSPVIDSLGNTTLSSISTGGVATPLGKSLGNQFSGLALDTASGLFYGITNDASSFSTLVQFSLAGPVTNVAPLGFGFGALTYDSAQDLFWAIGPVNNSASQLYQITPAGVESAPVMTLGDGFAELAVQPFGVPEPRTGAAVALAMAVILASRVRRPFSEHLESHKD
jgi:hypothetical protein